AEIHAAAAMHRESGRLVEDEEPGVLVDDPVREPRDGLGRGARRRGGGSADGGHSDAIAGSKSVARGRASRVDSDLAGADQSVNVAAGNALEARDQEIVEALASELRVDLPDLHGSFFVLGAAFFPLATHKFRQIVHKKVYVIVRTTDFARGRPSAGSIRVPFRPSQALSGLLLLFERVLFSASPDWCRDFGGDYSPSRSK